MDGVDVNTDYRRANALVPPEARLAMPLQRLRTWHAGKCPDVPQDDRSVSAARAFVFGVTGLIAGYGTWEMASVVGHEATFLQSLLVVLFALTFVWIALAAANALLGFALLMSRRPPPEARPAASGARTAVVMPVYNEDTERVFRALQGMADEIVAVGQGYRFDVFVLSDSTAPAVVRAERRAARRMQIACGGAIAVYYRRRKRNIGRKAGNIADFVSRWGGAYEYMIVLDADSYVTARAMTALVGAMDADPAAGLIQTVPRCVGRNTLFARMQQFADAVYGRLVSAGMAAWHGHEGNYWGHNAIVRVRAFAACCRLPVLNGRKPLGGTILSHDFVEAALLRRGGWGVYMLPWLSGSYEEAPPTLADNAQRDRRWVQGNLQHAKVLSASGLHPMSRLHLVSGIMSYVAAPLWLLFLLNGFVLAVLGGLTAPDYFPHEHALFPTWPRFDAERALALMGYSLAVLLMPKVLGLIAALADKPSRRGAGGSGALIASVVLETLAMALIAPVMMLIQTRFIVEVLLGRDSGWQTQRRDDGSCTLADIARQHLWHTLAGLALLAVVSVVSVQLLLWLLPVWLGLSLVIPLAYVTGRRSAGELTRRWRLFLIREEIPFAHKRARRRSRSSHAVAWDRPLAAGPR